MQIPHGQWALFTPTIHGALIREQSKCDSLSIAPVLQWEPSAWAHGHNACRAQTSRKDKWAEVWQVALFPPTIFTTVTQTVNTYISCHFFFSMIICIKSLTKKFYSIKANYFINYIHVHQVDTPITFNIMTTVSPRWWGGRSRSTIGKKGFQRGWQGPNWRLAQITSKAAAFMGCSASAGVNWGQGHGQGPLIHVENQSQAILDGKVSQYKVAMRLPSCSPLRVPMLSPVQHQQHRQRTDPHQNSMILTQTKASSQMVWIAQQCWLHQHPKISIRVCVCVFVYVRQEKERSS